MATAQEMIKRAMRLFGGLGTGEDLDASEAADGLVTLNAMLDSWQLDSLLVYSLADLTFSLVAGTRTYTIGPSGTVNTLRPIRIESAWTQDATGNRYECRPINKVDIDRVTALYVRAFYPSWYNYEPTFPLGTLSFYPTPSMTMTFAANVWSRLQSFANLTDTLSLPPGYEDAIVYNLAIHYAAEFGIDPPASVPQLAMSSKARVKAVNAPSPVMRNDFGNRRRWDINADF